MGPAAVVLAALEPILHKDYIVTRLFLLHDVHHKFGHSGPSLTLQIEEKWNGKWIFATPATPFRNAISERLVSTIKQAIAKDYTPYLVETHLVGPNLVGHIWSNPNLVRSNLVQPTFGPTHFWSSQIWSNPNLVEPFVLLSMC